MAKWFPDKRGLAVGLAVGGYGAGSAIFGPLSQLKLIPAYGLPATFQILGGIFLVMTLIGALPAEEPAGRLQARGLEARRRIQIRRHHLRIQPRRGAAHAHLLPDVGGLRAGLLRRPDGDQPTGARSPRAWASRPRALSTMTLVVGACGNASGRILSGWMSDKLGRINVLRTMIGISMVAMPALYAAGGNVAALYLAVFVVYWCYGTQLSVNGAATSDFWGTKNAGINYGMLFTAWGVAGIIGPRIGGVLFDKYHNYQAAFYTAAVLAAVALVCEMLAKRPAAPRVLMPLTSKKRTLVECQLPLNPISTPSSPKTASSNAPTTFAPRPTFAAWTEYERLYQEAETDPEKFWGEIASELHWFKPWDQVLEWDCPWAKWFSGGQTQPFLQLPGPPCRQPPPQQGRHHLGRRTRRSGDAHLPATAASKSASSPTF